MRTKKIYSWGNNFSKSVEFNNDLSKSYGICSGNRNSYGDCFIPHSKYSYEVLNKEESTLGLKINPTTTIQSYIHSNNQLLFGIPGKENVTIGGAIASDVHGKDNTWGGSFSKNIESLNLKLANGELIYCSDKQNRDVFRATIGGYGLTGVIEEVTLKENNIPFSSSFKKIKEKGSGLENLFNSFLGTDFEYWVAWVNLLNNNFDWVIEKSSTEGINKNIEINSLESLNKFSLPFIGKNSLKTMSLINNMFYKLNSTKKIKIVDLRKTLYPLSFISDTRNISPNRKILQVQFSVPLNNELSVKELIETLIQNQTPLLCSIKRLGEPTYDESLSFYQNGWTVAIDFSEKYFNIKSYEEFIKKLINVEGKIYLAKDSLLSEKHFKQMYPNYNNWEKLLKKIDPSSKFQSQMSNRLGLKQW